MFNWKQKKRGRFETCELIYTASQKLCLNSFKIKRWVFCKNARTRRFLFQVAHFCTWSLHIQGCSKINFDHQLHFFKWIHLFLFHFWISRGILRMFHVSCPIPKINSYRKKHGRTLLLKVALPLRIFLYTEQNSIHSCFFNIDWWPCIFIETVCQLSAKQIVSSVRAKLRFSQWCS